MPRRSIIFLTLMLALVAIGALALTRAPVRAHLGPAQPLLTPTPSSTPTPCIGGPSWTVLPSVYPGAIHGAALVAQGGALYSFGGAATGPTSAAYRYNPPTDTWTAIAPLPAGLVDAGAVSDGTSLYIVGGATAGGPVNTLYRYNPATDTYTTLAPFVTPAQSAGVVFLGGKIYRIAGTSLTGVTNSAEVYTISSNTWSAIASYPLGGYGLAAISDGTYVYTAGGVVNSPGSNKTYRYDPAINIWDDPSIADLPVPRFGAASGLVNGNWILAGGVVSGTVSNDTTAWNPGTNLWITIPAMPKPRSFAGGAALGTALYVVGGFDPANTPSQDDQLYQSAPSCTVTPTSTAVGTPTSTATPTLTVTPGRTVTPLVTASPEPIASGPGDQGAPDIDNGYLVWEDNHSGTWDVYMRDLYTGLVVPIHTGPGDQRHPAISGGLIVWEDNSSGNWDIYGTYLVNDQPGPEFLVAGGPGDQVHPTTNGDDVVWESAAPGSLRYDIVSRRLSGGPQTVLSNSSTTNINPAIDGATVVWQSTVPTMTLGLPTGLGRWNVLGDNLTNGGTFTVTEQAGDNTNPAISGNTVVWQNFNSGPLGGPAGLGRWSIDGAHIGISGTFTVTNSADDQVNPTISGDSVVFQDRPLTAGQSPAGLGRWSVEEVSLTTGAMTNISNDNTDSTVPVISHGVVAWQEIAPDRSEDVYTNLCGDQFGDVAPTDYFYTPVEFLSCRNVISGYADGSFRPYAQTTRAQLCKIVVLGEDWTIDTTGGPHFSDVPPANPFYGVIETAYNHGIISGYANGTFNPYANVSRGQLSKIIVGAEGWALDATGGPHFSDVPAGNPFYLYVETAYNHAIISGYADGTFRVGNPATRGQIAKIVYGALTSGVPCSGR